jgi:hypothetical protein
MRSGDRRERDPARDEDAQQMSVRKKRDAFGGPAAVFRSERCPLYRCAGRSGSTRSRHVGLQKPAFVLLRIVMPLTPMGGGLAAPTRAVRLLRSISCSSLAATVARAGPYADRDKPWHTLQEHHL